MPLSSRAAIHEAGHAVIGRALGMICGHASIMEDNNSGGHSIIADPYLIAYRWEEAGKYRSLESVYVGRILAFMAGAEAEIEILGACEGGDSDDRRQIALMAEELNTFDNARLRKAARMLVRRHRTAIDAVAAFLAAEKTLSDDRIVEVLTTVTRRH
jgi:hypothetical protein